MMLSTLTYSQSDSHRSFKDYHKLSLKLLDSQITLFWINGDNKQLKPYVRNRVVEIRRFSKPNDWYFILGDSIIADLGTRRGVSIFPSWFNGYP